MPEQTTLPLRDIHLPTAPGWWPPAPGWWIIAGLGVVIVVLMLWFYRRYQRRRLQREALSALDTIQAAYDSGLDEGKTIQALSIWLRRVCISCYPAATVAGLTGQDWLRFLDQQLSSHDAKQGFSSGPGRQLLSAPYQATAAGHSSELLLLCRQWLKQLPYQGR